MTLWATWQISTAIGIALGAQVPENISLDFALPLTFLALLIPTLVNRPSLAAAVSAGAVSVLMNGLPYRLGLLLGSSVGIGVAVLLHRHQKDE
jgi:predicted branched-subunit amino acid permease